MYLQIERQLIALIPVLLMIAALLMLIGCAPPGGSSWDAATGGYSNVAPMGPSGPIGP